MKPLASPHVKTLLLGSQRFARCLRVFLSVGVLLGSGVVSCGDSATRREAEPGVLDGTSTPVVTSEPQRESADLPARAKEVDGQLSDPPFRIPVTGDAVAARRILAEAQTHVQAERYEKALVSVRRALKADPASVEARLLRVRLLLRNGAYSDPSQALEDARILVALRPELVEARWLEGKARFVLGDSAGSRLCMEAVLAEPELDERLAASAHGSLGKIALRRDDGVAALAHLEIARRTFPQIADLAEATARAYKILDDVQRERQWIDEALRLEPLSVRVRAYSAQWYQRHEQTAKAARERRVHELLRQIEDNVSAEHRMQYRERAAEWGRLAELLEGDAQCVDEQIRVLVAGSEFEALAALKGMVSRTSGVATESLYQVAVALAKVGRHDAADEVARLLVARPSIGESARKTVERELRKLRRETRQKRRESGAAGSSQRDSSARADGTGGGKEGHDTSGSTERGVDGG